MSGPWPYLAAAAVAAAAAALGRPALTAEAAATRPGGRRRPGRVADGAGGVLVASAALLPLAGCAVWLTTATVGPELPRTAAPAAVVLSAAAAAAAVLAARQRRRRVAAAHADRVLESCELLAAELSAGLPPGRALARAAGAEPLLGPAASAERLGADVAAVLRAGAATPGAAGLARLAAAWEVSRRTGQRLAPAVLTAAESLRRDRATQRVIDAELASARATARLLAVLPVLALAMGGATGGSPWAFLLGTAPGVACLAIGLGLGVAGLAWIERITDAAEGPR